MLPYGQNHDWRRQVNRGQIELCLHDGYVLDERAAVDQHGNWAFKIARVCAGLDVVIDVVLEPHFPGARLFVVGISGDQIP